MTQEGPAMEFNYQERRWELIINSTPGYLQIHICNNYDACIQIFTLNSPCFVLIIRADTFYCRASEI